MTDLFDKILNRGVILLLVVAGCVGLWWYAQQSTPDPAKTAHLSLGDATFGDRVLASPRPVLVDFSATWCGPCQMQKGPMAELEQKYVGRLDIVMVDIDEHRDVAASYGIQGIPALRVFSGGKLVGQGDGYHDLDRLESLLADSKVIDQINSKSPVTPARAKVASGS